MSSDWMRWLCRMTLKASKSGKEFVMVGVSKSFLESADMLAIENKLTYAETVEGVWAERSLSKESRRCELVCYEERE